MRILAIGLMIMTVLLAGCVGYAEPEEPVLPEPPSAVLPTNSEPASNPSVVLPDNPPMDRTWVSPGKVNVSNYYPGGRAEYPVTIHNGKDIEVSFAVSYRFPDNVATGYDKPPAEAQSWVIVADLTPLLMPKETRDILVVLAMPEEATIESRSWEFWVSVMDMTQTGTLRTELCVRWLIDMR